MDTDIRLRQRALDVVGHARIGLFMTFDPDGFPHGRWMNVFPVRGLRTLFALSADGTRKIEHLRRCPKASWLFASDNFGDVVLLKGQGAVHRDFNETQETWDHLSAATREYVAGPLSDADHLDLLTIETTVERIELISPSLGVYAPQEIGAP